MGKAAYALSLNPPLRFNQAASTRVPVPPQMGMGKTACAVGAIQMNPPPEGWRANRAYQGLRLRDHLCECTLGCGFPAGEGAV